MRHLDRYTLEICSQLRLIAENRQWMSWNVQDFRGEDLLDDFELSYHLHIAAEASGARAGMAPMPCFPISVTDAEGRLDPAEFIKRYSRGLDSRVQENQSDNRARTELFSDVGGPVVACVCRSSDWICVS